MRCFNHHDRDAFGIDIITGKALCLECLEEYKGRIVERNNENSKTAIEMVLTSYEQLAQNKKVFEHNEKIMKMNNSSIKILFLVFTIISILFFVFGILLLFSTRPLEAIFPIIISLILFVLSKKIKKSI